MPSVQFPRKGFYHPAFGRLGTGEMAGTIYDLPSNFTEEDLPKGTIIFEEEAELEEAMEEQEQAKLVKPKLAADAQTSMPKKQKRKVAQAADAPAADPVEKTTGVARRRRRATKAA